MTALKKYLTAVQLNWSLHKTGLFIQLGKKMKLVQDDQRKQTVVGRNPTLFGPRSNEIDH